MYQYNTSSNLQKNINKSIELKISCWYGSNVEICMLGNKYRIELSSYIFYFILHVKDNSEKKLNQFVEGFQRPLDPVDQSRTSLT